MSDQPASNPNPDDGLDEPTIEELVEMAYLNSLPDENGVRPIDLALSLIDEAPPDSRRRSGAGSAQA